jgi:hypothetical protein
MEIIIIIIICKNIQKSLSPQKEKTADSQIILHCTILQRK